MSEFGDLEKKAESHAGHRSVIADRRLTVGWARAGG